MITPRERMQRFNAQNSASTAGLLSCSYRDAAGQMTAYMLTAAQARQVHRQVRRTAAGFTSYYANGGVEVAEVRVATT